MKKNIIVISIMIGVFLIYYIANKNYVEQISNMVENTKNNFTEVETVLNYGEITASLLNNEITIHDIYLEKNKQHLNIESFTFDRDIFKENLYTENYIVDYKIKGLVLNKNESDINSLYNIGSTDFSYINRYDFKTDSFSIIFNISNANLSNVNISAKFKNVKHYFRCLKRNEDSDNICDPKTYNNGINNLYGSLQLDNFNIKINNNSQLGELLSYYDLTPFKQSLDKSTFSEIEKKTIHSFLNKPESLSIDIKQADDAFISSFIEGFYYGLGHGENSEEISPSLFILNYIDKNLNITIK